MSIGVIKYCQLLWFCDQKADANWSEGYFPDFLKIIFGGHFGFFLGRFLESEWSYFGGLES